MQPIDYLRADLSQHTKITFCDFMQQALYSPKWGYYNRLKSPLGAAGDFITAPELTPLFGYTLAHQCEAILKHLSHPALFEFGAGSGRLCIDILTHLEKRHALPETYHILEISGSLRNVQEQNINQNIPHLANRVQWHTTLPTKPFEGVIIANEVLDAMPVHRFLRTNEGLLESKIGLNADNQLTEYFEPCTNSALTQHVRQVIQHDVTPYASEANLFIQGWIKACFNLLIRGAVLLIDYGFPQHEYYHPDRHQGTLMCHYQHKAHPNPLLHPGEEDITAHVDFTHVADSALQAGFEVTGYTNQASFLLANGLLDLLKGEAHDAKSQFQTQQAVKKLVQPNEMGELFKIIGLTKSFDFPLSGFQLHDKRASLDT
ncbi:MAG: SAM-dependent methyltransferase [Legionellaceae bacterium]|nr:SAM-dependent methyltransferase [Legionellaceae bacterium]